MAHRVVVDVETEAQALDLSQALAVRGFASHPGESNGQHEVQVWCKHEKTDLLLGDLLPTLEAWRLDRRHGPLPVRVGADVRLVGRPLPNDQAPAAGAPAKPPRSHKPPGSQRGSASAGKSPSGAVML